MTRMIDAALAMRFLVALFADREEGVIELRALPRARQHFFRLATPRAPRLSGWFDALVLLEEAPQRLRDVGSR